MSSAILCLALAVLQGEGLLVQTDRVSSLENTLLVDVRSSELFAAGHIPVAANLDVTSLSETRGGVSGLLKPVKELHALLSASGVDPAKHIVAYSGMDKPDDFKDAARVFWILEYLGYAQVSILDGGFAKWKSEGRPAEQGPSTVQAVTISGLKTRSELLASMEEVQQAIQKGDKNLVDWRSADLYHGSKKADFVKTPGHIPTATNLSSEQMVAEGDKTLKTEDAIEALANQQGVDLESPTIAYCNSGRSASTGYFVLRMLGNEHVSLYDGSMAEWTASKKNQVECDAPVAEKK